MKKMVLVIDIDGVLSSDHWRRKTMPLDEHGNIVPPPEDWTKEEKDKYYHLYNAACGSDSAIEENVEALEAFINVLSGMKDDKMNEKIHIVFLTGRPIEFQNETVRWLNLHKIFPTALNLEGPSFHLIMRERHDDDPCRIAKPKAVARFLEANPGRKDARVFCWDDRQDVIDAYLKEGYTACRVIQENKVSLTFLQAYRIFCNMNDTVYQSVNIVGSKIQLQDPADTKKKLPWEILLEAGETFKERNGVYKDNYKMVPELTKVLFPEGISKELLFDPRWHLFELMLVKLSRAAISGLDHKDSMRDLAVYAAMIESLTEEK